ncbi:unnamed protein product [Ilex paraguariensis]
MITRIVCISALRAKGDMGAIIQSLFYVTNVLQTSEVVLCLLQCILVEHDHFICKHKKTPSSMFTILDAQISTWLIKGFLGRLEFRLVHIFREANEVADRLAGQPAVGRNSVDYSVGLQLPCEVFLAFRSDQLALPVLRKRKRVVFDDKGSGRLRDPY